MVTDAFARTLSLYHIPANLFIYSFDMPRKDGRNGGVQWGGKNLCQLHAICFLFNILVENLRGRLGPKHTVQLWICVNRNKAGRTLCKHNARHKKKNNHAHTHAEVAKRQTKARKTSDCADSFSFPREKPMLVMIEKGFERHNKVTARHKQKNWLEIQKSPLPARKTKVPSY